MRLAIMQPYLFPYIGYFQLIHAVDKFVFYDDVNFIRQGWVNRNRILVGGRDHTFSVPVKSISSFKKINETELDNSYKFWRGKFLKTVEQSYKRAVYFEDVMPLIERVFSQEFRFIHEVANASVLNVCKYLSLDRQMEMSSAKYHNTELKSEARVLDICKIEKATVYINVPGGEQLYSRDSFKFNQVDLKFIQPVEVPYKQFKNGFVSWLSIIDVLMFNEVEFILKSILPSYQIK